MPFEFFDDRSVTALKLSSHMLFNGWMGVGSNDRHAHIASPKQETLKSRVKKFIFDKHSISSLGIKRERMVEVVARLNEIDPVYIEGYSGSLYNTARLVREMNLGLDIRPRAIIATSEDLIDAHRKLVSEVFGAPVFNRYGSREFSGAVAQECQLFEGLHVNTALCYLELLDNNDRGVARGERGRITITDLNNRVMPFIRYDTGDTAVKGKDQGECRRTLPLIHDVVGKSEFFLVSIGDEFVPMETIQSYLFQHYAPEIHRFQFIHDRKGHFFLNLVPTSKFSEDVVKGIEQYLDITCSGFEYEINIVDDIQPSQSGKTHFFLKSF